MNIKKLKEEIEKLNEVELLPTNHEISKTIIDSINTLNDNLALLRDDLKDKEEKDDIYRNMRQAAFLIVDVLDRYFQ